METTFLFSVHRKPSERREHSRHAHGPPSGDWVNKFDKLNGCQDVFAPQIISFSFFPIQACLHPPALSHYNKHTELNVISGINVITTLFHYDLLTLSLLLCWCLLEATSAADNEVKMNLFSSAVTYFVELIKFHIMNVSYITIWDD